uniref:Uncharacterized protein n=1 Tax=Anopheles maculatus TaxID=74869 RepID=A0A182SGA9_9DIPT
TANTNAAANGHANGNNGHEDDDADDHQHRYETDSIDGGDDQRLADEMQRIELHPVGTGADAPHAPHTHALEVKFADQPETLPYEDIPEPGPDPDPYDFHPHHLELHHDDTDGGDGSQREHSLSPQSVS